MSCYEFECKQCGRFEVSRRYEEMHEVRCPACRGNVRRVYSPTTFTFGFRLSEASHKIGAKDELVRRI